MANKVQYGVSGLTFIPLLTEGSASEAPTWDTTKKISVPGTVQISVDYDGDESNFAADNNPKYFSSRSNSGNSGEIENALIPDELKALAYGWRVDSDGGLVEVADGKPTRFAMGYQIEGDESNRRVWHYNVTLGFPDEEHNTVDESIEPDTQTLSWSGAQVNNSGERVYRYGVPSSASTYGAFLDSVALPKPAAGN